MKFFMPPVQFTASKHGGPGQTLSGTIQKFFNDTRIKSRDKYKLSIENKMKEG